jgi:hypothetical protein
MEFPEDPSAEGPESAACFYSRVYQEKLKSVNELYEAESISNLILNGETTACALILGPIQQDLRGTGATRR